VFLPTGRISLKKNWNSDGTYRIGRRDGWTLVSLGLIQSCFFVCAMTTGAGAHQIVAVTKELVTNANPTEKSGWLIFAAIIIIIATGIIQFYFAYKRNRIIAPPPLPPPAERPGDDEPDLTIFELPEKVWVFPAGKAYHISSTCHAGGKEYALCKICKRKNDDCQHLDTENRMQGNSTARASSAH